MSGKIRNIWYNKNNDYFFCYMKRIKLILCHLYEANSDGKGICL